MRPIRISVYLAAFTPKFHRFPVDGGKRSQERCGKRGACLAGKPARPEAIWKHITLLGTQIFVE